MDHDSEHPSTPPLSRIVGGVVAAAVALATLPFMGNQAPASAQPSATTAGLRDVMFVGNNWSGTAAVIDARTFKLLKAGINLIPDKAQEIADIKRNPVRYATYMFIQQGPGEGHDQYVDDLFTTTDGAYLAVSRPSFGDVIWVDVAKAAAGRTDIIAREQSMDGARTDHMGLSPDGRRLLVSDSTKAKVIEYSMINETVGGTKIALGDRLRSFPSGETPHENNYSPDGGRIYHASIGKVYLPGDSQAIGPIKIGPLHDALKGDRWFEIVDNATFAISKRWQMGKELAEAGYRDMSAAVRPMAVAPDQRFIYFQVSYFHGIVEFDTQAPDIDGKVTYTAGGIAEPRTGAVRRLIPLPNRVPKMPLENYVNDSAHHGLSMNSEGTTLCAAGTMDDYAALVNRTDGSYRIFDRATTGHDYLKPYWTTEGLSNTCWMSLSGSDSVAVVDFATGRELAYLAVGDHPQRVRHGVIPESVIATWSPATPPAVVDNGKSTGAVNTVAELYGWLKYLLNPLLPIR